MTKLIGIENVTKLSSSFILSIESNDLMSHSVGDTLPTLIDNSGTGNNLITHTVPDYATYEIDSQGYKCIDLSAAAQYRTTNTAVQPAEITYCIVLDVQDKSGNVAIFAAGVDRLSIVIGAFLYIQVSATLDFYLPISLLPSGKSVLLVRRSLTKVELWINNVLVYSNSISITPDSTVYYTFINANAALVGSMYSIHVCNEYLTDEKIKRMIRYCAFKGGIKL